MTTPKPWAVGDPLPDPEHHSMTVAALSAGEEYLAAVKDTAETTAIKTVLESIVNILTLVRVRMFVLHPFLRPLIGDTVRTRSMKNR